MRTIITAIALTAVVTACGTATVARIEILAGDTLTAIAPPAQTGASRPLELHAFRVSVRRGDGTVVRDVLVVRDPSERTFWWTLQERPDLSAPLGPFPGPGNLMFAGDGRVAALVPLSWIEFSILASGRRAESLEEAKAMIAAELERDPDGPNWTLVDLGPHVGREFGTVPGMANRRALSIQHLSYVAGRWSISVQGLNGDTAEVTLSDDHRILAVTQGRNAPSLDHALLPPLIPEASRSRVP